MLQHAFRTRLDSNRCTADPNPKRDPTTAPTKLLELDWIHRPRWVHLSGRRGATMASSTAAMIGVRGHAKRATQWKDEEQTTGRVMSQKRLDFR